MLLIFYIVTFNFPGIPGNFSAFPGKFPVVASEAVRSHLTSIVIWLDMMEGTVSPRQYHSCGTFELDGRLIGIVSGGKDHDFLEFSEVIDFNEDNLSWKVGPKIPRKLAKLAMVQTNSGKLLIVGGQDENLKARAEISQLFCPDNQNVESCYWKDLEYQLEVPRINPYVIPLPNSFNLRTF